MCEFETGDRAEQHDLTDEIMRIRAGNSVDQCAAGFPLPDGPCERCGATEDETCAWEEE